MLTRYNDAINDTTEEYMKHPETCDSTSPQKVNALSVPTGPTLENCVGKNFNLLLTLRKTQ